jgi:hypothetical protein
MRSKFLSLTMKLLLWQAKARRVKLFIEGQRVACASSRDEKLDELLVDILVLANGFITMLETSAKGGIKTFSGVPDELFKYSKTISASEKRKGRKAFQSRAAELANARAEFAERFAGALSIGDRDCIETLRMLDAFLNFVSKVLPCYEPPNNPGWISSLFR